MVSGNFTLSSLPHLCSAANYMYKNNKTLLARGVLFIYEPDVMWLDIKYIKRSNHEHFIA